MPQPLSKVKPDAGIWFDADGLRKHPQLAAYAMEVIARWSHIDKMLAELLADMMRSADIAVAMAMYQAIFGGESKRAALLEAAAEHFGPKSSDYHLVRAVLECNQAFRNRRNDFAHHMWGTSKDIPDALLLVDPKVWVKHDTTLKAHRRAKKDSDPVRQALNVDKPPPLAWLDRGLVQVFRKPDLTEAVDQSITAARRVLMLLISVDLEGDRLVAGAMRHELLSDLHVSRVFQRLTSESAPAAPRQPPPRKRSQKQKRVDAEKRAAKKK